MWYRVGDDTLSRRCTAHTHLTRAPEREWDAPEQSEQPARPPTDQASRDPTHMTSTPDQHDDEIVHKTLNTDSDEPAVAVAETVAELEDSEPDELPTTYSCIDGMLDELYANPPSPEAQMEVSFTYAGYRITIEQDGTAKFVAVG